MALKGDLMASSLPAQAANKLGFDALTAFAAAGASQTTATTLTSNCANVSSGSGGVIIGQPDGINVIVNTSGGAVNVYPPVGGTINGGTLNAAFSLTNNKTLIVFSAGLNYIANMSA